MKFEVLSCRVWYSFRGPLETVAESTHATGNHALFLQKIFSASGLPSDTAISALWEGAGRISSWQKLHFARSTFSHAQSELLVLRTGSGIIEMASM